MKFFAALILCVPLCAFSVGAPALARVHPTPIVAVDDDPPPFVCPLCGGNAELHRKRMSNLAEAAANALLICFAVR